MAHMQLRIEDLPPEMLQNISELIRRPSDLGALCLASKTLAGAATARLYEGVSIDVDASQSTALPGFFTPGNRGLPFVKSLVFYPTDADIQDSANALRIMMMVITLLPDNGL